MKNAEARITLLLLLCLALTASVPVMAEDTVGVKSGDYIKYDMSFSSEGVTVTGWIKITIQSVSGTQINGTFEMGAAGYTIPANFTIDISTGTGTILGCIIPANLTTGQSIPGQGTTVQEVTDWRGRKAIRANGTAMGYYGQIYWDQATGVLLELTGSSVGVSYTIRAADTNLWGGGMDLWLWIIIPVVVVGAVAGALLMLRGRKPAVAPPPPEAQPPPSSP